MAVQAQARKWPMLVMHEPINTSSIFSPATLDSRRASSGSFGAQSTPHRSGPAAARWSARCPGWRPPVRRGSLSRFQYDRAATHEGRTNHYKFKWHGQEVVLRPMTPSQIIADSAPRVATCQGGKVKNESGQKKGEGKELVMLATKVDLREVRRDSTIYHLILVCKDLILSTNDSPPLPSALSSLLQEFEDIFPEEHCRR